MASSTQTPPSQVVHFDSSNNASNRRSQGSTGRSKSWPARRHTPYTKTPKSRRLHGKTSKLERTPVLPVGEAHSLKNLLNKTWHVYQVTPLNNFQQTTAALRKYSKHLSAALQAESQKGIGVDLESEVGDRAIFNIYKGLVTSDDNTKAVELTIKAKGQGRGVSARVICHAILCSVGAERRHPIADRLTVLPVLMIKGTATVTRYVVSWLQTHFDCHIKRMTFNPMALMWMVSMWAGVSTGVKSKPVELLYTFPSELEGLSRVSFTIEAANAKNVWDSIHDGESADITSDEVSAFIKALEVHFFQHFKVHLSGLTLSRIGTPLVYIGSEGRLKILAESAVHGVLQHITELAMDNF
ncbi:centromere protein L-like [Asterias rubens]|uniref:centromere protein L-like n=1 Tax=Asterias rubens TaxID=7604 RepID=UPI00145570AF|nr:centromere protein L-like [Asterias rubens]